MDEQFRDEYRGLGLRISYYRKTKGYTQEQLAELIDRNPVFVGHIEAPGVKKALSLDTLFAIAKALGFRSTNSSSLMNNFLYYSKRGGQLLSSFQTRS